MRNKKESVRSFLRLFMTVVVSAMTVMVGFRCPLLHDVVLFCFSLCAGLLLHIPTDLFALLVVGFLSTP
jgi:hypothetical protein